MTPSDLIWTGDYKMMMDRLVITTSSVGISSHCYYFIPFSHHLIAKLLFVLGLYFLHIIFDSLQLNIISTFHMQHCRGLSYVCIGGFKDWWHPLTNNWSKGIVFPFLEIIYSESQATCRSNVCSSHLHMQRRLVIIFEWSLNCAANWDRNSHIQGNSFAKLFSRKSLLPNFTYCLLRIVLFKKV